MTLCDLITKQNKDTSDINNGCFIIDNAIITTLVYTMKYTYIQAHWMHMYINII